MTSPTPPAGLTKAEARRFAGLWLALSFPPWNGDEVTVERWAVMLSEFIRTGEMPEP